jgi:hypothetical protein
MKGGAPGAEHYREIAGKLREVARSSQFVGARREISILPLASKAAPTISTIGHNR